MIFTDANLPPIDWSVTLPETLAIHELMNPDVVLYVLADPASESSSHVTYGQFVRACRRVGRLLQLDKDDSLHKRPVIAIVANTDALIYHTLVAGIMLAGAIPFPISQRNTAEVITHLVCLTSSQKLIMTSQTLPNLASDVMESLIARDSTWLARTSEPPVLSQLYPDLLHGPQAEVVQDEALGRRPDINSPCIYLHSSGSTGLPKAIPLSHHEVIKYLRYPATSVFRQNGAARFLLACMELPPSHGMAFFFQICVPLFHGASATILRPFVETPRDAPPMIDPDMAMRSIEYTGANSCFTIPAFLHEWIHNQRYIGILKTLEFVAFGGAAVSPAVGEMLYREGVTLRSLYGGTEFGPVATRSIRPEDTEEWEYLEVASDAHPYFASQGDGTYELQLISPPEYPLSVTNITGVNGYATSDLLTPHPTKSHLWKPAGRIDDVIVHSSGEKTVPAPMEFVIQGNPYISGAVMFGSGRMQSGILIEVRKEHATIDVKSTAQVAALRNLIWPSIEAANKAAPAFSRLFKEMILFTSRDKPLPRTSKETIIKKAARLIYAKEIDDIYTNAANVLDTTSMPLTWNDPDVVEWLLAQVNGLGLNKSVIKPADNIFEFGFDSLSATILHQRIARAIQSHPDVQMEGLQVGRSSNFVYAYQSVNALAGKINGIICDTGSLATATFINQTEAIERMIEKYSFKFTNDSESEDTWRPNFETGLHSVLLTGSTGSLGSHILQGLLQETHIAAHGMNPTHIFVQFDDHPMYKLVTL